MATFAKSEVFTIKDHKHEKMPIFEHRKTPIKKKKWGNTIMLDFQQMATSLEN